MMRAKIREGAMAMLEVKSVLNLLGTPVSYAYAVTAGPWIGVTQQRLDNSSQTYLKFPDQTAWVSLSVGYPRTVATRPVSSSE